MYCNFFGFSEKPFDVTPDPKFLYLSPGHRETLAALIYGIREQRGFITIVGEVGTGKTTLLNTVLGRLDENTRVGFIFNTDVAFDEMLNTGLVDLGLVEPGEILPKVEAFRRLNDFAIHQLSTGGNVVLLVDEAQNLDRFAMESLRLLSNLETRKHKLIQIVLSGQPELDLKLSQPELRQLNQRISLKRYITPLSERETYEYIQHRLSVADYSGPAVFSRRAQQLIWEYSGGVPRKINMLCDNALLIAYAWRQKRIDAKVIEEAIKDLSWSPFPGSRETQERTPVQPTPPSQGKNSRSRFATAASLVFAGCIVLLVGFFLGRSQLNLQGSGLLPVWTSIEAKTPIQLARPVQSWVPSQPVSRDQSGIAQEAALSAGIREKSKSGRRAVLEPSRGPRGSANTSVGLADQDLLANLNPPTSKRGQPATRDARVVVVKEGDNLSTIISQIYGQYDRALLSAVLRRNPGIRSPDLILAGQIIKLPEKE